ncbi:hypothetical protein Trydic_g976 [Trypoxylus dichotomus]
MRCRAKGEPKRDGTLGFLKRNRDGNVFKAKVIACALKLPFHFRGLDQQMRARLFSRKLIREVSRPEYRGTSKEHQGPSQLTGAKIVFRGNWKACP